MHETTIIFGFYFAKILFLEFSKIRTDFYGVGKKTGICDQENQGSN